MQGTRRSHSRTYRRLRYHFLVLPLLVLAGGFLLTYASWLVFDRANQAEVRRAFAVQVDRTLDQFQARFLQYQSRLEAIRALFAASDAVDRGEFVEFVDTLNFQKQSPGIVALGYIALNADKTKATIEYIYPEDERNLAIVGVDAFNDVNRETALRKSAQASVAVLSNPTRLLQYQNNGTQDATGYLLFMPIDAEFALSATIKPSTLMGWIYIAFRLDETLAATFDGQGFELALNVFDASEAGARQLVFASDIASDARPNGFKPLLATRTVSLLGRTWELDITSTPIFHDEFRSASGSWVTFIGLLLSVFLAVLTWLVADRTRALRQIRRINNQLQVSEQRWKFALEGAGDGVWDHDIASGKNHVSARWKTLLGFEPEEMTEGIEAWASRIHPDDYPVVMKTMNDYLKGERSDYVVEHRMRCKDGSWKWVLERGMIVERDAAGTPVRMVGTTADISRMKASEALIWQQANFDALTGLPNRRMFFDRLETEIARVQRYGGVFTLLFIDLDEFKEINDGFGHQAGDDVLKGVGRRLRVAVRTTDVVARLAGDEFTIILSQVNQSQDLETIVNKILDSLQQPMNVGEHVFTVSASIGAAVCPYDGVSADDLLNKADRAMYMAKAKGKNRWQSYSMPVA